MEKTQRERMLETLPKTLNKKYHDMIEVYELTNDGYDRYHEVELKAGFENDNEGTTLMETTVKDLNKALANCVVVETEEEITEEEKTFEVGQRFNMHRETDLEVGVRQAVIIQIDEDKKGAWVRIGKSNYYSKIEGKWLLHPTNLKDYCNTNIDEDLIE